MGTPSEEIWLGYNELPIVKKVTFTKRPFNNLRKRFPYLPQNGFDLMNKFLTYDPKRRITAEKALEDLYFKVSEKFSSQIFGPENIYIVPSIKFSNPVKLVFKKCFMASYHIFFMTPGNFIGKPTTS